MVVRALPRTSIRPAAQAGPLPPLVLAAAVLPLGLDMGRIVQPQLALAGIADAATALSALALLVMWLRFPRAAWLVAACFAAAASFAMRLLGADVAPLLSLLSVCALGIGGGFASAEISRADA